MKIERTWAMPNKWTFTTKPIKQLVERYVGDGGGWADPFAGQSGLAEITNDLNPDMPTAYHLHAVDFVKTIRHSIGVLFDPPYSLRQMKECYSGIGMEMCHADTLDASFAKVKDIIAPGVCSGGHVICCGWNSNGFGKGRGFEIIEILLVAHGGHHNDTIVTVEQKVNGNLGTYCGAIQ